LIGPQEKHRNLKRDKDSKDFFPEVLLLVKIPQKLVWEETFYRIFIEFYRVHSFGSKDFVEKIYIGIKFSKIPMNFLSIKRGLNISRVVRFFSLVQ
jgi:hypothetical protein